MTPKHGRVFHATLAAFWTAQAIAVVPLMWPPDWRMYLLEISLWANIATHLAGYSAERPSEIANNEGGQSDR